MTSRRSVYIEAPQGRRSHSMDLRLKLVDKWVGPVRGNAERVKDLPLQDVDLRKTLRKRYWLCDEEQPSQPTAQKGKRPKADNGNLTEREHHIMVPQPQRGQQQMVTETGPQMSPWLNMIITDLQLYSIVEEKGFLDLMRSLGHETLPSAADVYSEMVQMFDQTKEKVRRTLEATENITLACDFWNSKAGQFLTVTCHLINESWKQESFVLETTLIPEKSTSDSNINQLYKIARMWGIEKKVQVVVTNANNLDTAVQKVGWKHLSCFAKTLDKVARQITKHTPVGKVLKRCCDIAHFFCYNAEAEKKLWEAQIKLGLPRQSLITAKGDAWLSTLSMLERISEQHEALKEALIETDKLRLVLNEGDRKVMHDIIKALCLFKEVTEAMKRDQHCSASYIIPCLKELKMKLKEQKENSVAQLLAKHLCSDQFRPAEWLTMSTALDPRYKHFVLSDSVIAKSFKERFLAEMYQKAKSENAPVDEEILYKSNFEKLENYIKMAPLPREGNPLSFWRHNYKKLASFAPEYLNIVTTVIPLDRAFNVQKLQLMSSRRSILPPELLDMMLFLNGNCSREAGRDKTRHSHYQNLL
ncbi:zinc finger BED domain-containing protein 1-like [Colossoma macropomum]|uniref:zinc finger BED domain-containing protein 1-like n=1 Tax=Colossoma macropomum TaxID=42526 RepID=UPI001863E18A|nr:zinc finger BED domain-containing protein 1-like [Colossoma macropomum]XP_036427838.1 zinc finger BED domain-containing protein 1-like [Colossoma macropomum]